MERCQDEHTPTVAKKERERGRGEGGQVEKGQFSLKNRGYTDRNVWGEKERRMLPQKIQCINIKHSITYTFYDKVII